MTDATTYMRTLNEILIINGKVQKMILYVDVPCMLRLTHACYPPVTPVHVDFQIQQRQTYVLVPKH